MAIKTLEIAAKAEKSEAPEAGVWNLEMGMKEKGHRSRVGDVLQIVKVSGTLLPLPPLQTAILPNHEPSFTKCFTVQHLKTCF